MLNAILVARKPLNVFYKVFRWGGKDLCTVYIVYVMYCILFSQALSQSIELFKAVISEVKSWMT